MMLTLKDLEEIEELMDEKFDEKLKNLPTKDEFFTKMDEVMKELKDSREEQTLLSDHSKDHGDRIENLEKIHPNGRHSSI